VSYFMYDYLIKEESFIQPAKSKINDKSIAVLPFRDDSEGSDNQYFCDGMMDEILSHLQKIADLGVKSRTAVEPYRNSAQSFAAIAQELEVAFILEGAVRKYGNQFRVTAQLIEVESGNHLWSETYDGIFTDTIFVVQSYIAKKIASSLNAVITPDEEKRIEKRPTSNAEAYDLYLRGKFYTDNYLNTGNERDFENAIRLLEKAINTDSNFALPYVMMGYAYSWNPGITNTLDSIQILIDKALTLNPDLAQGYSLQGWYYYEKGQFEKAEESYQHSLTLNPNNDWTYKTLGMLYFQQVKYEDAFELWRKQAKLDPNFQPIDYADFGDFYLSIGNYTKS
ncbi:MAG: tetratricopeptide repeat protein, partial [Cyclobacteriaceae bacterium]|nr:tetratricopeptide repeat protein [Cyclobacteriaceae bacterium]